MKIALVDIDGCLVENGELNQALITKLATGKYDKVYLFTQRNRYLQSGTIGRVFGLEGKSITKSTAITTEEVVKALPHGIRNKLVVCTSLDQFYGGVGEYYSKHLKKFERNLRQAWQTAYNRAPDEPKIDNTELEKQLTAEKQFLCQQQSLVLEDLGVGPEKLIYPSGKVQQLRYLLSSINTKEKIQIDYFDDSADNLSEVFLENIKDIQLSIYIVIKDIITELLQCDATKMQHPRDRQKIREAQLRIHFHEKYQSQPKDYASLYAKYTYALEQCLEKQPNTDQEYQDLELEQQLLMTITNFLKGAPVKANNFILDTYRYAVRTQDSKLEAICHEFLIQHQAYSSEYLAHWQVAESTNARNDFAKLNATLFYAHAHKDKSLYETCLTRYPEHAKGKAVCNLAVAVTQAEPEQAKTLQDLIEFALNVESNYVLDAKQLQSMQPLLSEQTISYLNEQQLNRIKTKIGYFSKMDHPKQGENPHLNKINII